MKLRFHAIAALAALMFVIPTLALAQSSDMDPETIRPEEQNLTAEERAAARKLARVRAESRYLTAEERAVIQSQIQMLRAQGLEEDALYLEQLLNSNRIRMAPRAAMDGAAMLATEDGMIFINGDWYREKLSKRGGKAAVGSYLIHEIVHIKQFEAYHFGMMTNSRVWWNPDQNEVTAYGRQIEYLTRMRDTTQDPRLRAYYNALIEFLTTKMKQYEARARRPGAGKWLSRSSGRTLLLASNTINPEMKIFQTATMAAVLTTAPTSMLSASHEMNTSELTFAMQQTTTTSNPELSSLAPESVQSDAIIMEHADAVTFLWELTEKNGGVVPAYDSSTWTAQQYATALGRTLDAEEIASVDALLASPAAFRTPQNVVGQQLASQATGAPVLSVQGRTSDFTLNYGVDKDMKIIGSLLTGETVDATPTINPAAH